MHPIQYGPSLREVAEIYFPGSTPSGASPKAASNQPLVAGGIDPAMSSHIFAADKHARSLMRAVEPEKVGEGDLLWARSLSAGDLAESEQLVFGADVPLLLDQRRPDLGPFAWDAWIASPYTAYANSWDVFLPWDESGWPFDPRACVVHASRRVVVHADMTQKVSLRVSPTFLALVRAVSCEFLDALASGHVPHDRLQLSADGTRTTLSGLRVRTGAPLEDEDDPRLLFSRLLVTVCSELTDVAEARAKATRPVLGGSSLKDWLDAILKAGRRALIGEPSGVAPAPVLGASDRAAPKRAVPSPVILRWEQGEPSAVGQLTLISSGGGVVRLRSQPAELMERAKRMEWRGDHFELELVEGADGEAIVRGLTSAKARVWADRCTESELPCLR